MTGVIYCVKLKDLITKEITSAHGREPAPVNASYLPQVPPSLPNQSLHFQYLWTICEECWQQNELYRPKMVDVVDSLKINDDDMQVRVMLCLFSGYILLSQKKLNPTNQIIPRIEYIRKMNKLRMYDISQKLVHVEKDCKAFGGFAEIYMGRMADGEIVAIKRIRFNMQNSVKCLQVTIRFLHPHE